MNFKNSKLTIQLVSGLLLGFGTAQVGQAKTLNVYTSQKEEFVKPVFAAFEKSSGIKVQFVSDKGPVLIERLKSEGSATSADLLLTVDAGNLWLAQKEGLFSPVTSEILQKNIPSQFRHKDNEWFGFTLRARTILYNTKKVKPSELSTYEDLASAKWKGRLCLRTSKNVYNQSLIAMMLVDQPTKEVESTVKGWVGNLATDVFPDDTKMIEAIAAGQCDVGIANHYYLARLLKNDPNIPVSVFWANQKADGAHVNIFGAGILKASKNKEEAKKLLEWFASKEGQTVLTQNNLEYPILANIQPAELISKWGTFKSSSKPLTKAGELQPDSVQLMDRVLYK